MTKIKRLMKRVLSSALVLPFLMSPCFSTDAFAMDLTQDKTIYTVSNAHLDTQWNWDVKTSINSYIPKTFNNNFALFEKYPDYQFNFEGAFRYALAKEYYPEAYEKIKDYVEQGRWNVAGSSWDSGDVNIPSTEALMRNILYGNKYFENEFGKTSTDIFLPDCFGFGYQLPSVAAHMGLTGFSTQKLSWGSAYGTPFDIGKWYGVDGSYLISALNPGSYTTSYSKSLSASGSWVDRVNSNGSNYGVNAAYSYHGTGDTGGSPSDGSAKVVQDDINKGKDPVTGVQVLSAPADQLYRDITAQGLQDKLPSYDGELVMSTHGVGSYSSRTISKRWNRQNEMLADATERTSVMADWLGGAPYPKEKLDEAWKRFIWHQFHDDLTGTSLPSAYMLAWNDYILSLNEFSQELENGMGAIANAMDTKADGIPVIVYNPISKERKDIVGAKVSFSSEVPEAVKVYGPDGNEVPSQIGSIDGNAVTVLFLADMPSVGYKVYDVRPSDSASSLSTGLKVTDSTLENDYFKVTVNAAGDIASVYDKVNAKELLSAPSRLELLNDNSTSWPSWEILYNDVMASPKGYVSGPADMEIVENGPARVALKVTREYAGSTFTQIIRLASGDDAQRIDVDNNVDWNMKATNLKVSFPLSVSNPMATYDLGLGTIQRGNNTSKLYEVPAQQWADITDTSGEYGVSILNDCKYGWDKPNDNTLRLTLIHTPKATYGNNKQDTQDFGENRFLYSIYGHNGDYVDGQTVTQGERVNQPLKVFQTVAHDGDLGKLASFLTVSNHDVTVKAVKLAEAGDEYIVRVQETSGSPVSGVTLEMGSGILSAREVNGYEDPVGPATLEGGKLLFDMKRYEPKTFAVKLVDPSVKLSAPDSTPLDLPFNKDVVSFDSNRNDGALDIAGRTIPGELFPDKIASGGVHFNLGPAGNGDQNAVAAEGQEISIPEGYKQVYLLAASTAGDMAETFMVNGSPVLLNIQDYKQNVGQWDIPAASYYANIKREPVAWTATHTHTPTSNSAYDFIYLFKYRIDLPEGANTITLPDNNNILVFAMTAANNVNGDTIPAGALYDEKNAGELASLTVANGSGSGLYPVGSTVPISAQVPSGYLFKEWVGAQVADPTSPSTTIKVPKEGASVTAALIQLGPNLALNKPVTASGYVNSNEAPKFGVDGSTGTKWCQTGSSNKWLSVDLQGEYEINRWVVRHAATGGENASWNTADFRLDVSSDGSNWTTVDTVKGNTSDITNRVLSPVKANYARLYITKATNSSDTAARIYEFEVYDSPKVDFGKLTVENGTGSGSYEVDRVVPISAIVPYGYLFKEWTGAQVADPKSPKTTIRIPEGDTSVTAVLTYLGKDLALNKQAEASSYINENEKPTFAVDGSLSTKWCTTTPGYNWLTVDLGDECIINKWVVRHAGAGGENTDLYWNTRNFRLDVSLNGTDWTTADTVRDNTGDVTAKDMQPVKARYARLYITDPVTSDFGTHIRIYSFEVYCQRQLEKVTISVDNTKLERNQTSNIVISEALLSTGEPADLTGDNAQIEYMSTNPAVISIEDGIIRANNAGDAEVYVVATLNGITVESNRVHVKVTTSADSISNLLKYYENSGDLTYPLVPQLTNSLDQAVHQMEIGMPDNAMKHMEDFLKHLNNEAMKPYASKAARSALDSDANALIDMWKAQ
ncbi:glycoside hydrolase family 38 C-terminal domain-containing protein [Sinanaerobacter chloroacetimidivorans]|uniref:Discoidin domain-containing protein n=1 Tax=Sinanaerobacter chloroacetimidivorans TaxID=2818044 RepID=A0A8J7VX81_9FIRM|nr:glycoside hydrolase family 38 C-terminal domain-containing protein [Sinanaerobacter chloroacetimidivorans]MBR0596697.1 discoidin domain-containing protein [Sinanaerobacter chloroacetimidivorans]